MPDGRSPGVREGIDGAPSSLERQSVARLLAAAYDLTPAEARLAAYLVGGRTPAEIASELAISEETVRTQLKRIYDKTSTRRQAELVRVGMRLLIEHLRRHG